MESLNLFIPLILFLIGFSFWFLYAPYHHYKAEKEKMEAEREAWKVEKEQIINDNYEEHLENNMGAKKDAAHRVFCQLYDRGKSIRENNLIGVVEWDEKIQETIKNVFSKAEKGRYLKLTGRDPNAEEAQPLKSHHFEWIMENVLRRSLKSDFGDLFKLL